MLVLLAARMKMTISMLLIAVVVTSFVNGMVWFYYMLVD
jgi:hypothetical protein